MKDNAAAVGLRSSDESTVTWLTHLDQMEPAACMAVGGNVLLSVVDWFLGRKRGRGSGREKRLVLKFQSHYWLTL